MLFLNDAKRNIIFHINQTLNCMMHAQFGHTKTGKLKDNLGTKRAHSKSKNAIYQ